MSDDADVSIVSPDGRLGTVPKSSLQDALRQGYKLPSAEQGTEVASRQKYGQVFGTELRAGAGGAARGLTFGASDLALAALGDKEGVAERKARNPWAAGGGEAAGVVGGLLLPTGIAGAGVRGAAAAGEIGSRGVAALLARAGVQGESLAARALASGAKAATGSAIEGSLYGAGQGISEAALGDPADAAEKILGHATMGALLGGTLGGAAGALGGVGSKALERFAKPAAELAESTTPSVAQQAMEAGKTTRPEGLIKEWLNDFAGEQALRAAGLPKAAYKKLDRMVKAVHGVDNTVERDAAEMVQLHSEAANIMRKERLAQVGDTFEDVGNRVRTHLGKAAQRDAKFIADTDAAAEGPLFSLRPYIDEMKDFAKTLENRPEMAAQHSALSGRIGEYEKLADKAAGTVRITEAQAAQRSKLLAKIDDLGSNPSGNPAGVQDKIAALRAKLGEIPEAQQAASDGNITLGEAKGLLQDFNATMEKTGSDASTAIGKQARGIFNKHLEAAAKDASSPEAFAAWKTAKREQEALIPVLKGNESKMQSLSSNRSFSLTDNIGGAAAIAHFGVNPLGAISALGVAGANKVMREYGSAAISDFAARAAQGLGAQRGAQALQLLHVERTKNAMTARLQAAAEGIASSLGKAPKAVTPLGVVSIDKVAMLPEQQGDDSKQVTHALHDRVTEITNLAENPQLLQQRLEDAMGGLPAHAPRLAAQMHFTAVTAVNYLADQVPKNPYADSPRDIRQAWRPPLTKIVAFERTIRAIHDPLGTIEEFQQGHVTKEAADALRAVYPTMYGKLVEHIVPAIVNAPKVPLQRRLQLASMLGTELDTFTSSKFAADMQQVYAESAQQAAPPARPGVSKNYRAKQSQTPLQRALSEA